MLGFEPEREGFVVSGLMPSIGCTDFRETEPLGFSSGLGATNLPLLPSRFQLAVPPARISCCRPARSTISQSHLNQIFFPCLPK